MSMNLDGGSSSEDFASLFGEPEPVAVPAGEEPAVETPGVEPAAQPEEQTEPEPTGGETPAAEPEPVVEGRDVSRIQSELDTLKERTKDYDNLQQLLSIVTSNPALNEAVRLAVAGLDPTQAFARAAQAPEAPVVQGWKSSIPDPVKPQDFDEFQSTSDPSSASYKYRVALEEKRIQDTIDKRMWELETKQAQDRDKATQVAQRQQAQAQARQIMDQALVAGGLQEKSSDFYAWVTTELPKASPQMLMTMFKAARGLGEVQAPPVPPEVGKKKDELARQRKAAEEAVAAGATVPGVAVPAEDDQFFAGHGTAMAGLYS